MCAITGSSISASSFICKNIFSTNVFFAVTLISRGIDSFFQDYETARFIAVHSLLRLRVAKSNPAIVWYVTGPSFQWLK